MAEGCIQRVMTQRNRRHVSLGPSRLWVHLAQHLSCPPVDSDSGDGDQICRCLHSLEASMIRQQWRSRTAKWIKHYSAQQEHCALAKAGRPQLSQAVLTAIAKDCVHSSCVVVSKEKCGSAANLGASSRSPEAGANSA